MFEEMNKVRADPKSLIPYVQKGIKEFNGKVRRGVTTHEGTGAWNELISVLESQQALKPMTWSNGMAKACQLFAEWSGPNGIIGHNGPNGKSMAARIEEQGTWQRSIGENVAYGHLNGKESLIQLMVDDGVSSRGHRKNILKENFGVVGIAIHTHVNYKYMTCMDFAGGFSSSQDKIPAYTSTPTTSSKSAGTTSAPSNGSTPANNNTKKNEGSAPATPTNTGGTKSNSSNDNTWGNFNNSYGSAWGNNTNGSAWGNNTKENDNFKKGFEGWRRLRTRMLKTNKRQD